MYDKEVSDSKVFSIVQVFTFVGVSFACGGGCDDYYQCLNILTIRGGHSPSRKSPPIKVFIVNLRNFTAHPSHIPCQPSKIPMKPLISRLWRWCYSAIITAHPSKTPTKPAMARCHAGVTPLVRQSIPMNLLMISLNTLKKSALQCLWDCVGFVLSVLLIFLR